GYDYADIQRAILGGKGDAALIQWDAHRRNAESVRLP
ncbi:cytidine deaminase, partial [Salmonella enterica subsp. enterica serovar Enteritidis str. SE30663]